MALSGFINPYPGKLGVVEEGALADLLLVDGDPIGKYEAHRRPRQKFSDCDEGWQNLQKHVAQVKTLYDAAETVRDCGSYNPYAIDVAEYGCSIMNVFRPL